jgi:uncharacterized phage protein (TIGR01671 family)
MREIKFQVWDGSQHKMSIVGGIVFDKGRIVEIDSDDGELICYEPSPKIQLRQFTGLKDKNGKEIYEGDIVRLETNKICVIQYADCWAKYMLGIPPDGEHCYKYLATYPDYETYAENLEVIANIWESPEVLAKGSE